MAAPWSRLTFPSRALAPSSTRIEKPRSPALRPVPEWCLGYQRRIEAARREYLLIKEQAEPEEALEGQGEIEMLEQNTDLVQEQLLELAQQIVHVIEACNEEKDVLEEEFDSVRNGIMIMESRLQTEQTRIDSEISGPVLWQGFRKPCWRNSVQESMCFNHRIIRSYRKLRICLEECETS